MDNLALAAQLPDTATIAYPAATCHRKFIVAPDHLAFRKTRRSPHISDAQGRRSVLSDLESGEHLGVVMQPSPSHCSQ